MKQSKAIFYALLILVFSISACSEGEDSIRLIPENYEGTVLIIFNQTEQNNATYEEGKRLYTIPESGVLLTSFGENYGAQTHSYGEYNSAGNRKGIAFFNTFHYDKFKESNYRAAFGEEIVAGNKDHPPYKSFLVGQGKDLDKLSFARKEFIERELKRLGFNQ